MKRYKTISEVKQNVPEIVDRINTCKMLFDCAKMMLEGMQRACVFELTHPEYDGGWWTTIESYTETFRNQMDYLAEIEYLDGLLKRLPNYKEQNI